MSFWSPAGKFPEFVRGRAVCEAIEGRKAIYCYVRHIGKANLDPAFGGDRPVEMKPKRQTAAQFRALLARVLEGDPEAVSEARLALAA